MARATHCLSICIAIFHDRDQNQARDFGDANDGTYAERLKDRAMDETAIDRTAMGRLAKALVFICGADHPTTVALAKAAETGTDSDIKKARALFIKLKHGDRRAALTMLED